MRGSVGGMMGWYGWELRFRYLGSYEGGVLGFEFVDKC